VEPDQDKKPNRISFPEFEAEILKAWDKEQTFKQSLEQRRGQKIFRFYDGPPFANGLPHYGHALASIEKDSITRYKTMRGYYVPRRAGWDTHGLPVEYEVEKQLGLSGKQQILEIGIDKFNAACRASVFKYKAEWEQFFHRFGRWIETEQAYATLDDNYIESVWWVFAEIYKKGLVYQGFRSMPYCPRCATPLSNFELNQGYQDGVEDPSVYVKFWSNSEHLSYLAWTTTPWTLPANAALAVHPEAEYVTVELVGGDHEKTDHHESGQTAKHRHTERLVLAKQRLGELSIKPDEYKVIETRSGSELAGKTYEPLYDPHQFGAADIHDLTAWKIYLDDTVSLEDGTGILHIAPRYGESDLKLGLDKNLPLLESVDSNGKMVQAFSKIEGLEDIAGEFFKEADPQIIADLTAKGRIFAAQTFKHTYPFCWRCDSPLLYFATPSWFVRVSSLRQQLVENNQKITWVPAHIKEGRFGNWLAEARDWGISRNRFWGAPIPIWVNQDDADDYIVVASMAELEQLSGLKQFDMHRPGIDKVVIERDGQTYRRVEEVFDCWFECHALCRRPLSVRKRSRV
jgi:isoleucyl-tRNA synthetase